METAVQAVQDSIVIVQEIEPEAGSERRREPRIATDRLTSLYIAGQTRREPILCRILDYSSNGLRIRTQKPLDPGTEVRVTLRELFAIAKVRYCNSVSDGFDHGIQVEEVRSAEPAVS